jgi:hypothetical protein
MLVFIAIKVPGALPTHPVRHLLFDITEAVQISQANSEERTNQNTPDVRCDGHIPCRSSSSEVIVPGPGSSREDAWKRRSGKIKVVLCLVRASASSRHRFYFLQLGNWYHEKWIVI